MPRKQIDYSKGLIYKIVCKDVNIKECYYGSTTNFRQRKTGHKTNCNNINSKQYNQKKYQFIRENGGWDNFVMLEIEKFSCKDKNELNAEERRVIDELKSKLNCNVPGRTKKEYCAVNKEHKKEYDKEYNEKNKEKMTKKVKCDKCGCEVSKYLISAKN